MSESFMRVLQTRINVLASANKEFREKKHLELSKDEYDMLREEMKAQLATYSRPTEQKGTYFCNVLITCGPNAPQTNC